MPQQNLISDSISEEQKTAVLQRLQEIKAELSFLLTLQPDEIMGLVKAGNSFAPFIQQAYNTVNDHPEIMPGVFDTDEFKRDCELSRDLGVIETQARELANSLENTLMAANSDAMNGALEVYAAVKQNRDKVPGLNVVAEDMAEFFKRSKRNKNED